MSLNVTRTRELLRCGDLRRLFIDGLGWDQHHATVAVQVDGQTFSLTAQAQKRGMVAFTCPAEPGLPDYALRRKIERQVAKSVHEHIIIFTAPSAGPHVGVQVWQWVRREPGKPAACREHVLYPSHSGEPLIQRLQGLAFTLDEEESTHLPDVTGKVARAFDVERVTKRFYDRFKTEHAAFLKFIAGIDAVADRQWYASIMLNRLMFIYFIQKKGFLDADPDYLRKRLRQVQQEKGKDRFLSFYRYFLIRLMHQGLGLPPEARKLDQQFRALLGNVPYLNGGIFEQHQLEARYPAIDIPDKAFEAVFGFFDEYRWHLDERPLRDDREINPDVLGYIFEKYINQKQMGAYYTKEDITEYIAKNTVLPFILDKAKSDTKHGCPVAFKPDSALWRLLRDDPDRYIYPAVRHGVIDTDGRVIPLPPEVGVGVADVSRRGGWNKPAAAPYALPTETWREHVVRRQRCLDLRRKLAAGEASQVNELITLNLDIRQFAQDVIETCEGPELLRALYHAISTVTVLDPTCGSGAFLFAALSILESLYEACLDRMERFIADAESLASIASAPGSAGRPAAKPPTQRQLAAYEDFRQTLAEVQKHEHVGSPDAARRYFIFKSIILNNLFGVDIMDEAVEICRLRLFLKLVAQVEPDPAKPNLGVEPLPDIDFNIRTGNTLVGFTSIEQVRKSQEGKLAFAEGEVREIEHQAAAVETMFATFRRMQTNVKPDSTQLAASKKALRHAMRHLADRLDRYLAGQYGADAPPPLPPGDGRGEGPPATKKASPAETKFQHWRSTHHPFHWITEFYGIMHKGGFDAIIGNPPYLEAREVAYSLRRFLTLDSGAIHAMCVEQSLSLIAPSGGVSMILPMSLVSTQRMAVLQRLIESSRSTWYANFAWRPGKLFDKVNRALTIFVAVRSERPTTYATCYQKWNSDTRDYLMPLARMAEVPRERRISWVPKLASPIEQSLLRKCQSVQTTVGEFVRHSKHRIYYRTTGGLYWKVFTDFAPAFRLNGKEGHSSRETSMSFDSVEHVPTLIAALSSDLFWWWYTISSNLRDLNPSDVQGFPLPTSAINDKRLAALGKKYLADLIKHSTMMVREQKQTGTTQTQSFKIQRSKSILDEIDAVLAKHYGFTPEELDFIINYDIKYRVGADNEGDAGDE